MRRALPWIFAAVAMLVVVSAIALFRGVLVASTVEIRHRGDGSAAYFQQCRYVYFYGFREVLGTPTVFASEAEARVQFCPVLGDTFPRGSPTVPSDL
jgi:hypothetical protein